LSKLKKDYKEKVYIVIKKLEAAKLLLDIIKSDFSVKKVKYLSFIIKVEKGISIDLEKVKAIKE
jgi:hypothetical protein